MRSKFLFFILKSLVVLFPIGAGLFLTNLGVVKLNEASTIPIKRLTTPYGFLVFSSTQLQRAGLGIWIGDQFFSIKNDTVSGLMPFSFELINASSGEQAIGFQLPGFAEFSTADLHPKRGFRIEGDNGQGKVSVEVIDEKAVLVEETKTSIVYAKFVALPNVVNYEGTIFLTWKGLIAKEGFSTYNIMLPVAKSNETLQEAVYDYFPRVYAYYGNDVGFMIGIQLPEDCELKRVYPLPNGEQVMPGGGVRLFWDSSRPEFEKLDFPHPLSELITVNIEIHSESELRNRLFFDSGLYMGLGISLVFSGIYEALKFTIELKRKRTE